MSACVHDDNHVQRARRDEGAQEGADDDLDDYQPFVSIKDRRKQLVSRLRVRETTSNTCRYKNSNSADTSQLSRRFGVSKSCL